jgi:hypothetical protein
MLNSFDKFAFASILTSAVNNNWPYNTFRHCLWILGNERALCNSESDWEALVRDAKNRQCFFNADEDHDLTKAILDVKKEFEQFDDLFNGDSILFRSARWKVLGVQ